MNEKLDIKSQFILTAGLKEKHDYRRDNAWSGRYLMRLPNRQLVWADEYEDQLKAWNDAQNQRQTKS